MAPAFIAVGKAITWTIGALSTGLMIKDGAEQYGLADKFRNSIGWHDTSQTIIIKDKYQLSQNGGAPKEVAIKDLTKAQLADLDTKELSQSQLNAINHQHGTDFTKGDKPLAAKTENDAGDSKKTKPKTTKNKPERATKKPAAKPKGRFGRILTAMTAFGSLTYILESLGWTSSVQEAVVAEASPTPNEVSSNDIPADIVREEIDFDAINGITGREAKNIDAPKGERPHRENSPVQPGK